MLEFPIHFTLWYGSQALSYLAIFLCVYFTYPNFSQFSMPRITSRTPDMVWLIWNTNRFTPFVIGNCASINLNLNCICCCSSQVTRKSSPILSLCNWVFELSYQDLHLPLSWRESDIHRFNGRKKRKRDWHHGPLLCQALGHVLYTWSLLIHLITLRDRCYYYSYIK